MDAAQALEFVRTHGVVLVSATGPAPKLTEAIAGEAIKGSWWGHPKGKQIFGVMEEVTDHPDVLVCRLVDDKLTLVHRRLWPAMAAAAPRLPASRLCKVTQVHTAGGRHRNIETAFEDWLPAEAAQAGRALCIDDALAALHPNVTGERKAGD